MRKTNVIKTLIITIFLIGFSLVYSNEVQASEATLSVSNCNVGENFSITINIPKDIAGFDGSINVTYGNGEKKFLGNLGPMPKFDDEGKFIYIGNYSKSVKAESFGQAVVTVSNFKMYSIENSNANITKPVNSITTLTQTITISNPTPAPAPTSTPVSEPTPEPTPTQSQEPNGQTNNDKPSSNPSNSTPSNQTGASNSSTSNSSNTVSNPKPQTPTVPVNLDFKDTNEKMYTTRRVNVRQSYGTDSNIIQTLSADTEVTRTGISSGTKDGYSWSRVSYNGITGYLITGALTSEAPVKEEPKPDEKEKPQEKPDDKKDKKDEELEKEHPEKDEDTVDEEKKEQVEEENKITIEKISEELGTIPEVGINIMPFMFLGSVVTCVVLMFETKRRLNM